MPKTKLITQKRLKELLHYDPETGVFIRNISLSNRAKIGDIAGSIKKNGYIYIGIDGILYLAHRLSWLYTYGYFPEYEIDHKDRIRHHNWIDNIREVSRSCNMRNSGKRKNNKSGITGVYFRKDSKKWSAYICVNKKLIHDGSFEKKENAVMARWELEKKHNFPNCCTTSSSYTYLKKKGLIL